jgi:phosphoglycolate phosphatase-like HAD superfamily hydrolase
MVDIPFDPATLDAILFDMDGTLIDTDDTDVARWARRASRVYEKPERAAQAGRQIVMAVETPVNGLFTVLDFVGLDTPAVRLMIALNGGTDQPESIPAIAGAPDMLRRLAERYTLGVVSTRTSAESGRYLTEMGIRDLIAVIAGRDSTWRIKPHPQPVKWAAQQLGVDPMRTLMVGDTTVDIKAGIRAGSWTCAVLCGYGRRAELERAGADLILNTTAELADYLLPSS